MDDEFSAEASQAVPESGILSDSRDDDDGPSDLKGSNPKLSRKRTKTGCLTCRRRRIKCGEERPICGNCIKSKRQCEGYNQRVIFKDPLNTYRGPGSTSTHSSFSAGLRGISAGSRYSHFQETPQASQVPLPNIAPKPTGTTGARSSPEEAPFTQVEPGLAAENRVYTFYPESSKFEVKLTNEGQHLLTPLKTPHDTIEKSHLPRDYFTSNQQHFDSRKPIDPFAGQHQKPPRTTGEGHQYSYNWPEHKVVSPTSENRASEPFYQEMIFHSDIREAASAILAHPQEDNANWPTYLAHPGSSYQIIDPPNQRRPESWDSSARDGNPHGENIPWNQQDPLNHNISQLQRAKSTIQPHIVQQADPSSSNWKHQVSTDDDIDMAEEPQVLGDRSGPHMDKSTGDDENDPYDVSDEDMNMEEYDYDPEANFGTMQHNRLINNNIGILVALQATQDTENRSMRTYRSFIEGPEMLTHYIPSARNSPLSDPTTARIFCHFINVLAPSISLYERHPANPSLIFQGQPVPKSQQHIWAYTMPTLALANQALLHAMLALGSLHIAKLQNAPTTAALRHYHFALRRVAKSVSLPMRRGQPAILAATMLLGFYEVMSAEHNNWSNHLLGAKQLIKEIDFAGITSYLKTRKTQHHQSHQLHHHQKAVGLYNTTHHKQIEDDNFPPVDDVDENIVGIIMGKKLRYDNFGHVIDDVANPGPESKIYTQRDLDIYENQRDLFWWFAKQDAFQSIVSGNRPFLNYDLWSHCPPRAAIGRRDAVYGTFDHLVLLLGRLADFGAKDLKRKRKVMQANGGQWRPPPGFQMPTPPSRTPENAGPPPQATQMPPFAGMRPDTGPAHLPRGFSPARDDMSPQSSEDGTALEELTAEAEEEWHEIRSAFSMLQDKFGPDFQPLGPEYAPPINSPFGPALQYRTYSIAGVWMAYNMGLIVCHRSHPSMPPAAMMAAGIAARQTASFANEIGRIAAGIAPDAPSLTHVNIGIGSGLMESAFSLFVGGVQLQDPIQRVWTVQRMLDIARLTGWETSALAAKGCEASWERAAAMGRGPPYTRMTVRPPQSLLFQKRIATVLQNGKVESMAGADEKKLIVLRTEKVQYALGLLGVEEDFDALNLDYSDPED